MDSGSHTLAGYVKDVPLIGTLAEDAADAATFVAQVGGGVVGGAATLAGGVVNSALHPIDTARGLESMAEHVPVLGTGLKVGHGLLNAATGDADLGDAMDAALDPKRSMKDDADYWGQSRIGGDRPLPKVDGRGSDRRNCRAWRLRYRDAHVRRRRPGGRSRRRGCKCRPRGRGGQKRHEQESLPKLLAPPSLAKVAVQARQQRLSVRPKLPSMGQRLNHRSSTKPKPRKRESREAKKSSAPSRDARIGSIRLALASSIRRSRPGYGGGSRTKGASPASQEERSESQRRGRGWFWGMEGQRRLARASTTRTRVYRAWI